MSGSGQVLITRQLEILAMFFQKLSNGDLATDQSFHLVDGGALLKSSTLSSPICPSQQSSNSSINISGRKLSICETFEEEACAIFWLLQEISNSEVYHNDCGG